MCENETCPCQMMPGEALCAFLDLWESNYSVGEETEFYKQNPTLRDRLDELDRGR